MDLQKKKRPNYFWPIITDLQTAKTAAKQGFAAASFCAIVTAIVSISGHFNLQILSHADVSILTLADSILFAIIAWGIYRMYRVAAIAGLSFYLLERIYMWSTYGPKNPAMAILFSLMFINSIRGTFAYRRFKETNSLGLEILP